MIQQASVAAGEDKRDGRAADLGSENVPMEVRGRSDVIKANEGVVRDRDLSWIALHFKVWLERLFRVLDQIHGVGGGDKRKEKILSRDQHGAAIGAFECVARGNLRKDEVARIGRRRSFVF